MYSEIENILMAYSINLMENPVFLFSRFLTSTARGGIRLPKDENVRYKGY